MRGKPQGLPTGQCGAVANSIAFERIRGAPGLQNPLPDVSGADPRNTSLVEHVDKIGEVRPPGGRSGEAGNQIGEQDGYRLFVAYNSIDGLEEGVIE
jgi:hypothetical protein